MSHMTDIGMRTGTVSEQGFDTSGYHDLGHDFLTCYSKAQHLSLWWTYFGREAMEFTFIGRPWRATLCRVNVHLWTSFWRGPAVGTPVGEICDWCEVTR